MRCSLLRPRLEQLRALNSRRRWWAVSATRAGAGDFAERGPGGRSRGEERESRAGRGPRSPGAEHSGENVATGLLNPICYLSKVSHALRKTPRETSRANDLHLILGNNQLIVVGTIIAP